jgi:microcephalin
MEVDNILGIDEESVVNEDNSLITQSLLRPLAGVIAYVDVRVGANGSLNVGQGLNETLEELGASMATRLTKDVTHIIYKDGKCNLERINKREIFIVNPLWLDSCKRCNERVSEAKYPVIGDGGPGTPVMLGRLKRMKSLQPKPFEESVARSVGNKRCIYSVRFICSNREEKTSTFH